MKSIWEIIDIATSKDSSFIKVYGTEQERLQALADRENRMDGKKHLYDGFNCDLCRNKGYVMKVVQVENTWELVQSTCSCEKSRKGIRNLQASGLASLIDDYKFDNFVTSENWQKAILEKAKKFADCEGQNWFFMGGQSGSGKTHLCTAIAIDLLRKNHEVKYMLWKSDSRKIKNDNFDGGNLIEYYKNVEVLYIDDLFKCGKNFGEEIQKPSGGDINIAFEIINSRVAQKKKTIISSESTLLELFDIDEAIAGRIKQMCGEYCISISRGDGKNYRKRDWI